MTSTKKKKYLLRRARTFLGLSPLPLFFLSRFCGWRSFPRRRGENKRELLYTECVKRRKSGRGRSEGSRRRDQGSKRLSFFSLSLSLSLSLTTSEAAEAHGTRRHLLRSPPLLLPLLRTAAAEDSSSSWASAGASPEAGARRSASFPEASFPAAAVAEEEEEGASSRLGSTLPPRSRPTLPPWPRA